MNKLPVILEYIWAALAVLCLILGIHSSIKLGFGVSYMYFALSVLALIMFLVRRWKRLKDNGR